MPATFTATDRNSIGYLHGYTNPGAMPPPPPKNSRDASASSAGGPWQRPPTAIRAPKNTPRASSNPFVGGMPDTFSARTAHAGNPNRNAGPLAIMQGTRPPKRQKTGHNTQSGSKSRMDLNKSPPLGFDTHLAAVVDANHSVNGSHQFVNLVDDEDDEQEPPIPAAYVSKPPAASKPIPPHPRTSSPEVDEPADDDELDFLSHRARNTRVQTVKRLRRMSTEETVQAGPSTEAVRRALANGTTRDVVELDSDEDTPLSRASPTRMTTPSRTVMPSVAKKMDFWEQQSATQQQESRNLGPGVKNRMQARSKLKYQTISVSDPTTASSNFIGAPTAASSSRLAPIASSSRSAPDSHRPPVLDDSCRLPLSGWIVGLKMREGNDTSHISFRRDSLNLILKESREAGYRALVRVEAKKSNVSAVESTKLQNGTFTEQPAIKLSIFGNEACKGTLARELIPGSKPGGDIVFRFDTSHEDWDPDTYTQLAKRLKDNVESGSWVGGSGSISMWQSVAVTCTPYERDRSRKDSPGQSSADASTEAIRAIVEQKEQTPKVASTVSEVSASKAVPKPRPNHFLNPGREQASGVRRRSDRLAAQGHEETASSGPAPDAHEPILIYPPNGRGSVNITNADVDRLAPGEYLNDTLIEFGLKHWLDELRVSNPALAEEVHVFSSYFYKKLNVKNSEEGYKAVRKWTAKVDIFQKKYLIIPVNEHYHWYLAIIFHPGRTLLVPPPPAPSRQTRQSGRLATELECATLGGHGPQLALQAATEDDAGAAAPSTGVSTRATSSSRQRSDSIVPDSEQDDQLSTYCDTKDETTVENMVAPAEEAPADDPMNPDDRQALTLFYPLSSSPRPDDVDVDMDDQLARSRAESMTVASEPSEPSMPGGFPGAPEVVEEAMTGYQDNSPAPVTVPERLFTDVVAEAAQPHAPRPGPGIGSVPAARFYGQPGKGKGKDECIEIDDHDDQPPLDAAASTSAPVATPGDALGTESDANANEASPDQLFEQDQPVIFSFDSLGSKHPALGAKLSEYLLLEAKDKQQRDRDTLTRARYQKAEVPTQPNSCDCGVYLLHFAKTFMRDPEESVKLITAKTRRKSKDQTYQAHWEHEVVREGRKDLRNKIMELSEVWKVERAARDEEERKARKEKQAAAAATADVEPGTATSAIDVPDDSDSDIELVSAEVPVQPPPKTRHPVIPASRGGKQYSTKDPKAERFR